MIEERYVVPPFLSKRSGSSGNSLKAVLSLEGIEQVMLLFAEWCCLLKIPQLQIRIQKDGGLHELIQCS
jgi:hypothetical protein